MAGIIANDRCARVRSLAPPARADSTETSLPTPMHGLPDLGTFRAVLFDLDGVLTPTADIHMHAWRTMFTRVFVDRGVAAYSDDDYYRYLDGKTRYEGVAGLLASRGIEVPWGDPSDASAVDTVCGIGNRKNDVFARVLEQDGIAPYAGSLALVRSLHAERMPMAIVSSSKNAEWVLAAASLRALFPVVVDGVVAAREGLGSKPAPDMFLYAARAIGVDPADAVVFEDAISGVAAASAGRFGVVVGVDRGVGEGALRAAGADVVIDDLAAFVGDPEPTDSGSTVGNADRDGDDG